MNNLNITFVGTKLAIILDKNKKTRITHRKKETKKCGRLPFCNRPRVLYSHERASLSTTKH